jgi:capsular polysaccharide biosynthesis protein/Mrp family chromosome partitioning ATPase
VELSFIISAIRRRLWLIVLFTIIGAVVGTAVSRSQDTNEYEATAALLVQPPLSAGSVNFTSNEPDRYVLGQQRVLESITLAEKVATGLDSGETKESIHDVVAIKHRSGTDILEVVVKTEDPTRSASIANAYAAQYMSDLRATPAEDQSSVITDFRAQIVDIDARLEVINPLIQESLRAPAGQNYPPPGDQALITERDDLVGRRNELNGRIIQIQADSYSRVTSSVVENAVVPSTTVATSSRLYVAAGLVGGLALGIVAAIMAARLSSKVLDRYEAETVLNQPIAGELVHAGGLTRSRAAALYELPSALEQVVSRVCARAQANAVDDRPLVIAVVGTQRNAGTTTLALAMAGRFARTDLNSVIIDFDSHDPELTELFASETGGIPTVLSYLGQPSSNGAPMSANTRARRIDPTTIFASTPSDRVRIIGAGADHDTLTLRRSEISRILEFAARDVEVVIADAGSLPDAAAAEQLVRIADCVVLAIPLSKLRASTLDTIERAQRAHPPGDHAPRALEVLEQPWRHVVGSEGRPAPGRRPRSRVRSHPRLVRTAGTQSPVLPVLRSHIDDEAPAVPFLASERPAGDRWRRPPGAGSRRQP